MISFIFIKRLCCCHYCGCYYYFCFSDCYSYLYYHLYHHIFIVNVTIIMFAFTVFVTVGFNVDNFVRVILDVVLSPLFVVLVLIV